VAECDPGAVGEALAVPSAGEWTIADLERLPDTGNRYEIVDGSLLVSPPPGVGHAIVTESMARLLRASAPADLSVFVSGPGLLIKRSLYVPDVVVVETAAAAAEPAALPPAAVRLVVEVLSPSNRTTDLVTKPIEYAAGRVPHYWIVDPAIPTLTVLRLDRSAYAQLAVVTDHERYSATEPFPVLVVPAHLRQPPIGQG
jgi:Uma2 family endonuclease